MNYVAFGNTASTRDGFLSKCSVMTMLKVLTIDDTTLKTQIKIDVIFTEDLSEERDLGRSHRQSERSTCTAGSSRACNAAKIWHKHACPDAIFTIMYPRTQRVCLFLDDPHSLRHMRARTAMCIVRNCVGAEGRSRANDGEKRSSRAKERALAIER